MTNSFPPEEIAPTPRDSFQTLMLKEFCYANTEAAIERDRLSRRENLLDVLRLHRFDVMCWLAANGVVIPLSLADDNLHRPHPIHVPPTN